MQAYSLRPIPFSAGKPGAEGDAFRSLRPRAQLRVVKSQISPTPALPSSV